MAVPLMPKATAAWLVDNTTLTFEQIANFCHLHVLEVHAMADGDISIIGMNPIAQGQLTQDEIDRCQEDPSLSLELSGELSEKHRRTPGARYVPLAKRQDKPDAVSWILRNCHELSDLQIIKLIGTTKDTIEKIRSRTHWNIQNIHPRNPVEMGLCSLEELETERQKHPVA
jgi:hypothetical protein